MLSVDPEQRVLSGLICNEMEANRVLYKNKVDRHECTLRKLTSSVYELVISFFVIYFGFLIILVCQSADQLLIKVPRKDCVW